MQKTLNAVLKTWIKAGKPQELGLMPHHRLETTAQAKLLGQALALIPAFPMASTKDAENAFNHPLEDMIFMAPHTQQAYEAALQYVVPEVRRLVDDALNRTHGKKGDDAAIDAELLTFAVKLLIEARQTASDIERLIQVMHLESGELNDAHFWFLIFSNFDATHPFSVLFYQQVATQLPDGFCAITLLDAANIFWNDEAAQRCIQKANLVHPFDCIKGIEKLQNWLSAESDKDPSYAESSAGALPFLTVLDIQKLLPIAQNHFNADVQIVAAWATIKLNRDDAQASLQRLIDASLNYKTSEHACSCLFDLGLESAIPDAAQQPEFSAQAEMFAGLMRTADYDHAQPSHLELIDQRELYWPPTKDKRMLYMFAYTYTNNTSGYVFPHYGVVGSSYPLSLALLSENRTVEEVYALHCELETRVASNSKAEQQGLEKSIAIGRAMLQKHNPGFSQ